MASANSDAFEDVLAIRHLARKIRARHAPDADGLGGDARTAEWCDDILAAADELEDDL